MRDTFILFIMYFRTRRKRAAGPTSLAATGPQAKQQKTHHHHHSQQHHHGGGQHSHSGHQHQQESAGSQTTSSSVPDLVKQVSQSKPESVQKVGVTITNIKRTTEALAPQFTPIHLEFKKTLGTDNTEHVHYCNHQNQFNAGFRIIENNLRVCFFLRDPILIPLLTLQGKSNLYFTLPYLK